MQRGTIKSYCFGFVLGFTGLDAIDHGFRVVALDDACRGVDLKKIDEMKKNLQDKGAIVVNTCKVGHQGNRNLCKSLC